MQPDPRNTLIRIRSLYAFSFFLCGRSCKSLSKSARDVDRFNPKKVYSSGEGYIVLKEPTPQQARQIFEQMKRAPRRAYDDSTMSFLPEAADFQAMHQPAYLPILKEFAAKFDHDAFEALERMQRLDANEVLVTSLASGCQKA
jgi:hypothetical protein